MRILPPPIVKLASALALLLSVGACTDEVPVIPSEELYLRGFVKQFGVPAEGHTWSMASPVEAGVSLSPSLNGTVTFYTDAPAAPGAKILATTTLAAGRADITFDVHSGTNMVYVRVADTRGFTQFSGLVPLEGNRLSVTASGSRAADCPITAEAMEWTYQRMPDSILQAAVQFIKAHPDDYLTKRWIDIKEESKNTDFAFDEPIKRDMAVQNIYKLNGRPERSWTEDFPWSEIEAIIDNYYIDGKATPAVFSESYNNKFKDNIRKFYQTPENGELRLDSHNSTIVENEGPVTLDLMWRGSHGQNYIFGYYYFTEDDYDKMLQDPAGFFDKVPKYVIYDYRDDDFKISGDNSLVQIRRCNKKDLHYQISNLGQDNQQEHNKENDPCYNSGEHSVQDNWVNLKAEECNSVNYQQHFLRGSILRGETIKLVYFGPDGKGAANYDFPKGMHIGFFGAKAGETKTFFCSDAVLGFYLFNRTYTQEHFKEEERVPGHYPKVARFHLAGSDYMGVELEEDNDLNDLVFRIRNVEPAPNITPEDFPEPESEEWIVACEDLGSTDDYDFNDIVLKLKRTVGTTKLEIMPLACGGVLDSWVYFGGTESSNLISEIHAWLGVNSGVMAGVGNGHPDIDFSRVEAWRCTVSEDWKASTDYGDIHIFTDQEGGNDQQFGKNGPKGTWINAVAAPGGENQIKAPQILLLSPKWRWPKERVSILEAYPSFKNWIGNPGENDGWATDGQVSTDKLYQRID